ncbi:hypothetical protein SAMN04487851_11410 [Prevotella sp. tc2-28]|nr:hypothetical protein SAMN04487851_11410 [Prevotella sp. tc2-28]
MKQQKIINKVYFVAVIQDDKVKEILTGKCLDDIMFSIKLKYRVFQTQIMEYNDEHNIYVPDVNEHLMMIRRQQQNHNYK